MLFGFVLIMCFNFGPNDIILILEGGVDFDMNLVGINDLLYRFVRLGFLF